MIRNLLDRLRGLTSSLPGDPSTPFRPPWRRKKGSSGKKDRPKARS